MVLSGASQASLDECIKQLKKSSLLALGPQMSIRQIIETGGGKEGGLVHAKSIAEMVCTWSDNEYLFLVRDVCEAFHKRYKTGTSTLVAYICFLLDSLRNVGEPRRLHSILDLIQESFQRTVDAVRLRCTCVGVANTISDCGSGGTMREMNVTDEFMEDDVSWFFQEETVAFDKVDVAQSSRDGTGSLLSVSADYRNGPLWRGLEHCLEWEVSFRSSFNKDKELNSLTSSEHSALKVLGNELGCGLPMSMAVEALSYVMAKDMTGGSNLEALPPDLLVSGIDRISFEKIHGSCVANAVLFRDAVLEFVEDTEVLTKTTGRRLDSPHVAAHGTRVYNCYHQAMDVQSMKAGGQLDGLRNVAVVDLTVPTDDNSRMQLRSGGAGGSKHADSFQEKLTQVTKLSDTETATSTLHNLHGRKTYIEKALARLQELNVQVLLCPYSVPLKLLDACYESGICVIPMSGKNLRTMAALTGANIVLDILDLYVDCLGCKRGNDIHNDCVVRLQEQKGGVRRVLTEDSESFYNSKTSVLLVIQIIENFPKTGHQAPGAHKTNISEANLSLRSHQRHCCVLIPCPTPVIGEAVEDRITKCIHRISLVLQERVQACRVNTPIQMKRDGDRMPTMRGECRCLHGNVVPGGGLVEVLAFKHLEILRQGASPFFEIDTVSSMYESYVHTVNINNGCPHQNSMTQWRRCHEVINRRFKEWKESHRRGVPLSIDLWVEFIFTLDTNALFELPTPIVIEEEGTRVLDIGLVKIQAMRQACYAVRAILSASHVIQMN